MVRKQIYIEDELERGLKALAARTGEAEAVHVRAALRAYLREHRSTPVERDPLLDLVGLVEDPEGARDMAEEHDHYLYGAPKRGR